MYDDDPQWRVMVNYLRAMYHTHPINLDIAGTVESISKITPEYLYRCYNTFYNLNNMAMVLCGSFDIDKVLQLCDKLLKPSEPVSVNRVFAPEPTSVVKNYVEEELPIALPLFQFGYKLATTEGYRSEKDIAAMEVLLETLASDSSPLFQNLLDRGLVNESSFGYEFFEGNGFATVIFSGESKDPQAVADVISEELNRFRAEGIPESEIEISKRAIYGSNIAALNSASNIANAVISFTFKNREIFTYIDALAQLSTEDVNKKLAELDESNKVLSVIAPL